MARFNTFLFSEETFGSSGQLPIEVSGERVPWIFIDLSSGDEYEFAVNPLDCSFSGNEETLTENYSSAGSPILFGGRQTPKTLSFSGTILYEEHFRAMEEWFEKNTQITLIDDLGNNYSIYLQNFSPTRAYVSQYPWRHEYNANAVILSWT